LIAAKTEGFLMAGKCLSASHEAVASARVILICMATGEAAGTWAGLSIMFHKNLREIDYQLLKKHLLENHVELGETLSSSNEQIINSFGQIPWILYRSKNSANLIKTERQISSS
jgi:hypothetical protein